jgi:ankyrin repeat protein
MRELNNKFYNAVRTGNLEKVKSLLSQGIILRGNVESHLQTPLHIAAYEGHLELVAYFFNIQDNDIGNPDVNARDNSGWTALHCAASPGHLEVCELLLRNKADPNICNNDKNIPLHYLTRRLIDTPKKQRKNIPEGESLFIRVIKLMTECNVNHNFANDSGETPLHQAASSGHEEAVRVLLKFKADPMVKNK